MGFYNKNKRFLSSKNGNLVLLQPNFRNMNFVDTHTHLSREYYPDDFDEVVARAIEAGVTQAIVPCVNAQSINSLFEAADQYPQHLFPLIGLHPTDITETYREDLALMESLLTDPRVAGIGEIGIDLYHDTSLRSEQQEVFYTQLTWARERNMPLSIHIRSGYEDALDIFNKFGNVQWSGVLHCFSGGIQEAEWAIRHGFALGIGGVVTFKNNKLQEIVKAVGPEHIVLETDAPFLAPTPHRGTRNESMYIPLIAAKVAEVFNLPLEEIARITTENSQRIFQKLKTEK